MKNPARCEHGHDREECAACQHEAQWLSEYMGRYFWPVMEQIPGGTWR